MSAAIKAFPRARRQTYLFLESARETCHVHLMTRVDATRIRAARAASGDRLSYVSFVVKAAASAIACFPDAQLALHDGIHPRLSMVPDIHAKVLFDKTVAGQRCVVSGVVKAVQTRAIADIQEAIDVYKAASVDAAAPTGGARLLQRLPLPLARPVYRLSVNSPRLRASLQGTFSVTSVGHQAVSAILPMIAGTLGFGLGRIADTPVVREGRIMIAPTLTLSLTFDHRVLDGAMAAELLAHVKDSLEGWEAS